jgi:hypothetical protein
MAGSTKTIQSLIFFVDLRDLLYWLFIFKIVKFHYLFVSAVFCINIAFVSTSSICPCEILKKIPQKKNKNLGQQKSLERWRLAF